MTNGQWAVASGQWPVVNTSREKAYFVNGCGSKRTGITAVCTPLDVNFDVLF